MGSQTSAHAVGFRIPTSAMEMYQPLNSRVFLLSLFPGGSRRVLGWVRLPRAPHVLHVYRQPRDPVTRTAAELSFCSRKVGNLALRQASVDTTPKGPSTQ